MPESMQKMNSKINQKLKMQAQEMGISMKDAEVRFTKERGYHLAGYKPKSGIVKAVDKGVKDGTLADRAKARRRRVDKAIDGS
jgi:hypothetical protein